MKNVQLVAPVLTRSGYGVHARQIASYLVEKHKEGKIQLSIHSTNWGITPWIISGPDFQKFTPFLGPQKNTDVSIQLTVPSEWQKRCAINVGMTAGNESDRWSESWLKAADDMDRIITPSAHASMPLLMAKPHLSERTRLVPESFSGAFLEPAPIDLRLERDFNFLIVGQITGDITSDRKNIIRTIRWMARHFSARKDVGLVVKLNSGRDTVFDKRDTVDTIKLALKDIPKGLPIKLVHGRLSDQEMSGLYRHPQIKALVTTTHGEGFGLPILEAAVCGLPVIATNWSAHCEFLRLGKFVDVPYELKHVPKSKIDNVIQPPGARWADVDPSQFLKRCEKVIDKYETPKLWATELSEKLQAKYSSTAIFQAYDQAFEGIL